MNSNECHLGPFLTILMLLRLIRSRKYYGNCEGVLFVDRKKIKGDAYKGNIDEEENEGRRTLKRAVIIVEDAKPFVSFPLWAGCGHTGRLRQQLAIGKHETVTLLAITVVGCPE